MLHRGTPSVESTMGMGLPGAVQHRGMVLTRGPGAVQGPRDKTLKETVNGPALRRLIF